MTAPARITQGDLGQNFALANGASHEFEDFLPPSNIGHVALMFRTNRAGTLVIERVAPTHGAKQLRSLTIADPTDEVLVRIDAAPLGTYRATFTNTSGLVASVTLEGTWGP